MLECTIKSRITYVERVIYEGNIDDPEPSSEPGYTAINKLLFFQLKCLLEANCSILGGSQ